MIFLYQSIINRHANDSDVLTRLHSGKYLLLLVFRRVLVWYDVCSLFIVNASFLRGLNYPILGVYSGIFALYLHFHAAKEETGNTKKIIFYALCVLYLLSVVGFVLDILKWAVSNNEPFFIKKKLR